MLVCNVSMRPARRSIAAELAEAVAAADATATGNIVFATLVDDPASVGAIVDAYLGEIMIEAASATAVVNAGLTYATVVVEAATAVVVQDALVPAIYTDAVAEAATAADTQNGTVIGAAAVPRDAMVAGAYINSDGTSREANVNGVMVNL